jgi:hypothetical protein
MLSFGNFELDIFFFQGGFIKKSSIPLPCNYNFPTQAFFLPEGKANNNGLPIH